MSKLWSLIFALIAGLSHAAEPPELALFEEQMVKYGRIHCENLSNPNLTFDQKLASTYYDSTWVYLNIAEYTKDASWLDCAKVSADIYAGGYVLPNQGNIPGYWKFTRGLRLLGVPQGADAIRLIARNGAYALESTPIGETADSTMSREVAYLILTDLDSQRLGNAANVKYNAWVEQAFGHMDQWFVSKTAPYVRPFMVSLTAQALIEHSEKYDGDKERVLRTVQILCDGMRVLWLPENGAFKYTDRVTDSGGTEAAPDLNLLIVPVYAWLYKQTGDSSYLTQADAGFAGGVRNAYLVNGKQFNQNYRWSFKYLDWRREASAGPIGGSNPSSSPTATPTPTPHPCEKAPKSTSPFSGVSCTNYFLKQIRDRL